MTSEEKKILLKEIPKYITENCYYTNGSIKCDDLWLVGWVAAEFLDRKMPCGYSSAMNMACWAIF